MITLSNTPLMMDNAVNNMKKGEVSGAVDL